MSLRRYCLLVPLAILAGCSEPTSAPALQTLSADRKGYGNNSNTATVLQQSPSAPPLALYQASFWLVRGAASTFAVRYQPAAGQTTGDAFLVFDVPKGGLVAGAGGAKLRQGDSVLVTLTIDPTTFTVGFEPSGVKFSDQSPARLSLWYDNANLDLNGNGVVDGKDWNALEKLFLWYAETETSGYKVPSKNDPGELVVTSPIFHFSKYQLVVDYAISW